MQCRLTVNLTSQDVVRDVLGTSALNLATNAVRRTQDLPYCSRQVLGERLVAHRPADLDNLLQRDGLGVLDVLLLLAVAWGLCIAYENVTSAVFDTSDVPLSARMTNEEAEGTTLTAACRFWIVSWTVTRRPFHAPVALAISSPTFLGD